MHVTNVWPDQQGVLYRRHQVGNGETAIPVAHIMVNYTPVFGNFWLVFRRSSETIVAKNAQAYVPRISRFELRMILQHPTLG